MERRNRRARKLIEREPFNNAEAKRRGTGHLRRWKAMFLLNVVKQFLLGVRAGVGNL